MATRDQQTDEGPLFKRSDAIIGSILVGFAWSAYSYLTAIDFILTKEGNGGAEPPDWVFVSLLAIAPTVTVLVLTGVFVRRPWARALVFLAAVGLIVLWLAARIELSGFW